MAILTYFIVRYTLPFIVLTQMYVWSRYGGDGVAALMRNILRRLLSNGLAAKYVLRNNGDGKETLEPLIIFKAIKGNLYI